MESSENNESAEVLISNCYEIVSDTSPPPPVLIEHCCLMIDTREWVIEVKCRPILKNVIEGGSRQTAIWRSLMEVYPEAQVVLKHNDIEVTLPSLQDNLEIAAFGRPGKNDQKRMQMAIFATRPTQGRNWKIWVYLVDDTVTACKKICQKQDEEGHRLLTPLSGMFVANSTEDIAVELSSLEPGWKVIGSHVKAIKSSDAWNSPENSTYFPRCYFEISHLNKVKQSFFCAMKASHKGDSARAEVVAYFERERVRDVIHSPPYFRKLDNSSSVDSKEINTSIQMFFFALFLLFASPVFLPSSSTGTTETRQHRTTMKASVP